MYTLPNNKLYIFLNAITAVIFIQIFTVMSQVNNTNTKNSTDTFTIPVGQRQLFLDDYGIADIHNLKRTMHRPVKKGAVIEPEFSWEVSLQTRCAPAWDPVAQKFKLWLIGSGGTSYAESNDGIHWTKPVLRQIEYNGSYENNFISVEPGLTWPANAIENVVYDPDDPDPSRRFKGLGHCNGREPIVSADGIHWHRLNVPKIPSQDESNLFYDRNTRTFIATVKQTGPNGRAVYLSKSMDFEKWTEPELIFHSDERDQELGRENIKARFADQQLHHPPYNNPSVYNVDVYNMGIFRYEGIYIGMPAMYHAAGSVPNYPNTVGFHLIQLVCSRDLKSWKRLGDRKPFIGPSPKNSGAYDLTQILPPSAPVIRDDELWFYYTGIKYRGTFKYEGNYPDGRLIPISGLDPHQGAICLAVLRRDGFISLDAGAEIGRLTTKAFVLPAAKMFINADFGKGWLVASIIDNNGNVIAESDTVKGNNTRHEVEWNVENLQQLKDQKVKISFTFRDAKLYSYWFEK